MKAPAKRWLARAASLARSVACVSCVGGTACAGSPATVVPAVDAVGGASDGGVGGGSLDVMASDDHDASGGSSPNGLDGAAARAPSCPSLSGGDGGGFDIWRDALGDHTLADRGRILGCVHVASATLAQVAANPYFGSGSAPGNGYELFIVQYVSEGRPGVPAAVTALLYLPSGDLRNVPIAAVEHATSGMGPSCGPTHHPAFVANVAIPLVGRGYAVVATDYAGMGIDNGMVSYLNGASEAAATLDGVRALLQFRDARFDVSRLSTDFFVVGHSQGGHAALFAHQYFDSTVGVTLLGSVSFAPGLGNAKDWSGSFASPSQPVGSFDVYPTMSLYSHMLYAGTPDPGTWLTDAAQRSLPKLFHDECSTLFSGFAALFPVQSALFTPDFLGASASCAFTAACAGFEPWSSQLEAEQPGSFASRAPALLLQGSADSLVLPSQTACIAQRMAARGTPVQACEYVGLDHLSIVPGALPDALRWMNGRRSGLDPSVCVAPLSAQCTLGP